MRATQLVSKKWPLSHLKNLDRLHAAKQISEAFGSNYDFKVRNKPEKNINQLLHDENGTAVKLPHQSRHAECSEESVPREIPQDAGP